VIEAGSDEGAKNAEEEENHTNNSNATVTDPACGMNIDPGAAAAQSEYNGQTYHFCSQHCAHAFAADPGNYVTSAITT